MSRPPLLRSLRRRGLCPPATLSQVHQPTSVCTVPVPAVALSSVFRHPELSATGSCRNYRTRDRSQTSNGRPHTPSDSLRCPSRYTSAWRSSPFGEFCCGSTACYMPLHLRMSDRSSGFHLRRNETVRSCAGFRFAGGLDWFPTTFLL